MVAVPLVYVLVVYFLASAASSSTVLYCDMCLRLRGCPVVLDIELSVCTWYQKTRCVLLRARRLLLLLRLAAARGGVRHKVQNYMQSME